MRAPTALSTLTNYNVYVAPVGRRGRETCRKYLITLSFVEDLLLLLRAAVDECVMSYRVLMMRWASFFTHPAFFASYQSLYTVH